MKFKMQTGMTKPDDHGIVLSVKAGEALSYGDVVILAGATEDFTQPFPVVMRSAADSVTVVGVVITKGGIASGDVGEIQVTGIADVRLAAATYTVGQRINTNGGGAGYGAAGTVAGGKGIGMVIEAGTVGTTGDVLACWLQINGYA